MRAWAVLAAFLLAGCALTSKAKAPDVRYFTPEGLAPARLTAGAVSGPAAVPKLRLGRIGASALLRARIVYRESSFELGTYASRRWTESPEAYLRRSLARALFADGRLVQAIGGDVPTLDAELVAFEEVRAGSARSGRVDVVWSLHDSRRVLDAGRVTFARDAATSEMEDVVAAIASALESATAQIAQAVSTRVAEDPAGPPRH